MRQEGRRRERQLTCCAVEETVPALDGVVDLVGAGVVVDLPQAEAYDRHLMTAVQLDRLGHCGCRMG